MEVAALLDIPFQKGVLVVDVAKGSAAMDAGMQRGDVITKANDQSIQSAHELEALVQSTKPRPESNWKSQKRASRPLL